MNLTEVENQDPRACTQDGPLHDPGTIFILGQTYTKHADHWYEDGNVGFILEDSAFLVHRTIISKQSSVIKSFVGSTDPTLATRPPPFHVPVGTNPMVPFFRLDDPVKDFAHVLDFIYPDSLPDSRRAELNMFDLMGVVEIADKYLILDLKGWAVERLGELHLAVVQDEWVGYTVERNYASDPEGCVRIISLSRRCNTPQFLPLAFYALAAMDWDGKPGAAACLDLLPSEDRVRIQEGQRALTKLVLDEAWEVPENGMRRVGCPTDTEGCDKGWDKLWGDLGVRWRKLVLHPLEELEYRLTIGQELLCLECFDDSEEKTRRRRDLLLGRLCDCFRLE